MQSLLEFARDCTSWSDEYLLEQYAQGAEAFTEPAFFKLISDEVNRRGLRLTALPDDQTSTEDHRPYFVRVWWGKETLPITYWIWGTGVNLFFGTLVRAVAEAPLLALVVLFLSLAYYVFSMVAIWRSAGNYRGPGVWSGLARVSVILGALLTIIALFGIL